VPVEIYYFTQTSSFAAKFLLNLIRSVCVRCFVRAGVGKEENVNIKIKSF
jgi:hypothetical protein